MVKTRENGERTESEVKGRPERPPEGKRAVSIRRGKLLFFPVRPVRPVRPARPARPTTQPRPTNRSEKEGKAPASETEVSSSSGPDEA
jgi:hypothetical protein